MKKQTLLSAGLMSLLLIAICLVTIQHANAQFWSLTGNAGTGSANFIGTTDNVSLKFRTNNVLRINITNNGKVGIGNFSPIFKLDVKGGSINTDSLYRISGVQALNRNASGNIQVGDATSFVGIGTSSPSQKLHVSGTIYSSSGGFKFPDGTIQTTASVAGANNQLSNLSGIAINVSLLPNTNNSKDLGGATLGWKDIYVVNKLYMGGAAFMKRTGGICIGTQAGNISTGNYNIFIGNTAGFINSTGASNVFVGFEGGSQNTTGEGNTFIGDLTGQGNTSGSYNTLLGGGSDVASDGLQNATAIGYGAIVNSSNSLVLGNNAQVGIGTGSPEAGLHIATNSSIANPQLLLYENENDYARLTFKNSTSATFWSIAGLTSTNTSSELLNFYNSTTGDIMSITGDGRVGIGTTDPPMSAKLAVAGGIFCTAVTVRPQANWPDYVFDKGYELPTLQNIEMYLKQNHHLPGIPSAEEVKKNGVDLGEMQSKILAKVEELTLYIIKQQKEIEKLKVENSGLLKMTPPKH